MSRKEFVHLHVHSHNSLLDGLSTQEEIAATCKAHGSRAFALTDHGFVSGAIAAYNAAKKHDIKFIPGEEIYLCRDNLAPPTKPTGKTAKDENETTHLLLLAKNQEGLRNLYKLSSEGATNGAHGAQAKRITNEHLLKLSSGLISTTGCLSSRISRHLKRGEYKRALHEASIHRDIFGKENYFVEVQNHGIQDQIDILEDQIRLAKDLGIGLVATNDSHYTHKEDAVAHDHFLALQTGATTMKPNRFKFDGDQHYIKSADEMYSLFPESDYPGACKNTLEIADMVEDIQLTNNGLLIPEFEYEEYGYKSVDDMLIDRCKSGLNEIFSNDVPENYLGQLEYELNIIRGMGIQSYFLIVAAIMEFCRKSGIWTGPGRGSAAGSLVSYALRITKVDPIEHGLIFSRFLNSGRTDSMPDIDVDIEPSRRQEVVEYMAQRWGDDRVVHISALQTFKAKSALERSAAVHDCFDSKGSIKNLKSLGNTAKALLPTSIKEEPDLGVWIQENAPSGLEEEWSKGRELRDFVDRHEEMREVVHVASRIQNRNRTDGIHPAGILITPGPATELFPIRKGKNTDLHVCQFNCSEVDQLNGLKMDLLGLSNLSVLELAAKKIERDLGKKIDLDSIPFDDESVYAMLQKGESDGVFQIESDGMKDLLRRVQPTSFEDISALIALFRPGPMGMNSHVEYADRKNGRKKVDYFHEDAREILEDTYGLVVYQEQVMAIAQKFAGYSEKEADDFRRAMGKKKAEVMEEQHALFVKRVADKGYAPDLGPKIWNIVEPFAGYAFNKAHSVSYGFIAYQTAWLKANYYPQFVAAFIDVFPKRSASMSADAINRGYKIGAPNINESFYDAKSSNDTINVGFNRVANFGEDFVSLVVEERKANGNYKSIVDFVARNPKVRRNSVESLIKAGAFSSLNKHDSRQEMLNSIDDIMAEGKSKANERKKTARVNSFFSTLLSDGDEEEEMSFDFSRNPTSKREARLFERDALGFFVGAHPFADFEDQIDDLRERVPAMKNAISTTEAIEQKFSGKGQVYGTLIEFQESESRNGNLLTRYSVDCGDHTIIKGISSGHGIFTEEDMLSLVVVDGGVEEDTFMQNDSDDVNLTFKFNNNVVVIVREPDSEIEESVMKYTPGDTQVKKTVKKRTATHSVNRASERKLPSAIDITKKRQQKRFDSMEKNDQPFLISMKNTDEKVIQNVLVHIVHRCCELSKTEGRLISVNINGEKIILPENVRLNNAGISLLRATLKELERNNDIQIKV